MPTDARLLALPSLRRQAESTFRERRSAAAELLRSHGKFNFAELIEDDEDVATSIEVEAALLADLTRWQSQAWALRRIGALVWREEPDYVPALNQAELELERGKHTVCWVLGGKCYGHPLWNDSHIPGIGRMSRPEAIAAILLHVEEA